MASQTAKAPINDLISVAKRWRKVRAASKKFFEMWAIEQASERLAGAANRELDRKIADPGNHDWSLLYRGNILDD